jgi:hypothetical protein
VNKESHALQIVGPKDLFLEVTLIEPVQPRYLMLALEVDYRPSIGFSSKAGARRAFYGTSKPWRRRCAGRVKFMMHQSLKC